jgi:hypothetical protein
MSCLWLVEDDDIVLRDLVPLLVQELAISVHVIRTEEDFRNQYQELAAQKPPSAAVFDIWLSWTSARFRPTLPPPECSNRQVAGVRCRKLLGSLASTKDVPVVYYSFFSPADVSEVKGDVFMQKRGGYRGLIEYLRQILNKPECPEGNAYRS